MAYGVSDCCWASWVDGSVVELELYVCDKMWCVEAGIIELRDVVDGGDFCRRLCRGGGVDARGG